MVVVEELGITFFSLVVGFLLAMRLGLPPVVGTILMGALIGPYGLGFIKQSETIGAFADIGATLLLFVIGIEFSITKLLKYGLRAFIISGLKVSFMFIITYEVGLLFGLESIEAVVLGFLFSITSTTLFSKFVKNNVMKQDEMMLLLAVLIIEDILAVMMLAFVSGIPETGGASTVDLAISVTQSLAVLSIIYLIFQKYSERIFDYIEKTKSDETLLFTAFTLAALLSLFASAIGLEPSIGAFLAGSLIGASKSFKKIHEYVIPFGLFFSSFFFLSTGMLVNFEDLIENLLLIATLVIVTMTANFFIMSRFVSLFQKSSNGITAGLTMLAIGEFSLLLAHEASNFVHFDILGVTASAVFLTSVLSAVLVNRRDWVAEKLTKSSIVPATYKTKKTAQYLGSIMRHVEPGGDFFKMFQSQFKTLAVYGSIFILWNLLVFVGIEYLKETGKALWLYPHEVLLRTLLHLLGSAPCIILMYRSLDSLFSMLVAAMGTAKHSQHDSNKRLAYNVFLLSVVLLLFFAIPVVVSILRLPHIFSHMGLIPLILAIALLWDCTKTIHTILLGNKRDKLGLSYHIGRIQSISRIPPRK